MGRRPHPRFALQGRSIRSVPPLPTRSPSSSSLPPTQNAIFHVPSPPKHSWNNNLRSVVRCVCACVSVQFLLPLVKRKKEPYNSRMFAIISVQCVVLLSKLGARRKKRTLFFHERHVSNKNMKQSNPVFPVESLTDGARRIAQANPRDKDNLFTHKQTHTHRPKFLCRKKKRRIHIGDQQQKQHRFSEREREREKTIHNLMLS